MARRPTKLLGGQHLRPLGAWGAALGLALLLWSGPTRAEERALPSVDIEPDVPSVRQPSVDAGVLLGVCGVGRERAWQRTRFSMGGVADFLWGRSSYSSLGGGLYGELRTTGFKDLRTSIGATGLVPLGPWLSMGARVGPLLLVDSGSHWGVASALEWGHRSVSHSSRYSMMHALYLGFDYVPGSEAQRPNTAISIGLRLDGFWLSAPAWFFR